MSVHIYVVQHVSVHIDVSKHGGASRCWSQSSVLRNGIPWRIMPMVAWRWSYIWQQVHIKKLVESTACEVLSITKDQSCSGKCAPIHWYKDINICVLIYVHWCWYTEFTFPLSSLNLTKVEIFFILKPTVLSGSTYDCLSPILRYSSAVDVAHARKEGFS